jgi:hypothetical protein
MAPDDLPRNAHDPTARGWRRSPLPAGALCLLGALFAASSLLAADRIPPWMNPSSIAEGLAAFPDDDVVQLGRFWSLEVDGEGRRTATLRMTYHVRAGDAKTCRALQFVESPIDKVQSLKGWRQTANGKTQVYDRRWTSQAQGGELYSQTRTLTLEIPEAGPGDFLGFELRYEQGFPEARADWIDARGRIPVLRGSCELSLPSGWSATGCWIDPERERISRLDPTVQTAGRWTWNWERLPGSKDPEPYEPSDPSLLPAFVVRYEDPSASSNGLRTWKDVSDWYSAFSTSALTADPELDAAATRLCAGATGQREQTRRIAEFVRSSIGYVQIYLADGGWRPHAAGLVYRDRFGDCKDMAHLAIALLRSAGVQAFPVLTNAGWTGAAWPQFPMPGAFNHCIVAIRDSSLAPSYLFFDATAKNVPLGRLPASVEGQWSLVVGSGADTALTRLPRSKAGQNLRRYRASVALGTDLRVTGSVEVLRIGQPAFEAREFLRQNTLDKGRQGWEESFSREHVGARVREWSCPDVDRISDTLLVRYDVDIPDLGRKAGNLVLLQPDFLSNRTTPIFPAAKRERAIALPYPWRTETDLEITLPEGWAVSEMPDSSSMENRFGSFARSCHAEGRVIHLHRVEEVHAIALPVEEFPLAGDWDRACFTADRQRVVLTAR